MPHFSVDSFVPVRRMIHLLIFCLAMNSSLLSATPTPEEVCALLAQKKGDHPRLFLRAGAEDALQRKIDGSPQLKQVRSELIANANEYLSAPTATRTLIGRRLLSVSRSCFEKIGTLSMAWRLTHDSRYLDRARVEMLAAAEFSDWNPSHFLDVAGMTAALAVGYDWLYPALDEETRAKVRKAIVEKGLDASFDETLKNNKFWIAGTNNWNQVCHGGMTLGALAVAEDQPELAAQVIARAVKNVPCSMHSYAPDGAFPEGPSYWSYGTTYNVMMISALESALGTDFDLTQQPGFLASSDYMVHSTGPSGLFYNYADCGERKGPLAAMYWFAARRNDPALLWNEELASAIQAKAATLSKAAYHPLLLIWAKGGPKAPEPKQLDWTGGGVMPVAFFRSGWKPDALFVGTKGGSCSTSHAHMDVGSFVFDAQGVRWAIDLGMQSYNTLESRGIDLWSMKQDSDRWKIFRLSNHSHNMLVINNQLQNVAGRATVATRGLGTANPEAVVDCSTIFAGQAQRVIRTVSLPDRHALVVDDAIQSVAAKGSVRWQMATKADITLSGTDVTLRQDGKTLRVHQMSPDKGVWSVVDISKPRQEYDEPNPDAKLLVLDVPVKAGESPRVTIKLTPE